MIVNDRSQSAQAGHSAGPHQPGQFGHPGQLRREEVEAAVRQALGQRLNGQAPQSLPTAKSSRASASTPVSTLTSSHASSVQGPNPLVVNVSARHVHLTDDDLQTLFGQGAKLTKHHDLYQEGEFASQQKVNVVGPRNRMIPGIRILGPTRRYSQVELSYTDGIFLGIDLPLRISGNHENTPGCTLVGPNGALTLPKGVIRAQRHVHMHPDDARHFGVEDGQLMNLKIDGPCGLSFDQLKVRVDPKVKLEVHIDTDEGNACHLPSATHMELIKP